MKYNPYKVIWLIILGVSLSSCQTPKTREVEAFKSENVLFSDVQFQLDQRFESKKISCIAVKPLSLIDSEATFDELPKERLVRQSLIGNLVSKNYSTVSSKLVSQAEAASQNNVKILEKLNCDAVMEGNITSFRNNSLVMYSATIVGLELTLSDREGQTIWSGQHTASSKDGAIPFSPFSLIAGLLASKSNSKNEVALQMVDAVARRLTDTIPDAETTIPNWEIMQTSIESLVIDKPQPEPITQPKKARTPAQLLAQGRVQEALQKAKDMTQAKVNPYENYVVGAKAAGLLNEYSLSKDYYLEALAIEESTDALVGLSYVYVKTGKFDLARAAFKKALAKKPQDIKIRFQYGLLLEATNSPQEATKAYYQSGELAFRAKRLEDLYKSLVTLKRLKRVKNSSEYYLALLEKAKTLLN